MRAVFLDIHIACVSFFSCLPLIPWNCAAASLISLTVKSRIALRNDYNKSQLANLACKAENRPPRGSLGRAQLDMSCARTHTQISSNIIEVLGISMPDDIYAK